MDEKTEELRDIFIDVTDEDTVTESQEETHGTLASNTEIEDRLRDTIEHMRDSLDFSTNLSTDDYIHIVRGFYADDTDADIARDLDTNPKKIARARTDLHLLRDADLDAPFDLDDLKNRLDAGETTTDIADDLDVSPSTIRRYHRIVDAQRDIRRVNDRYRDEFDSILTDREIAEPLTQTVKEDGLEEATEGQETNLSF